MLKVEIPRIECEQLNPTYGRFIIEPLERGYGHTLGSSILKILLSSIPGMTISGLKFTGYEDGKSLYTVEDLGEIILNIKRIIFRTDGSDTIYVKAQVSDTGEIKSGDFEAIDPEFYADAVDPDLHIVTVKDNCKDFSMELYLTKGKGYIATDDLLDKPEGFIPVDAFYSPIRKVDYYVQDTRVGQITDYDKLVFEIYTNGIITPDEAFNTSAIMFQEYLKPFIELSDDIFEGIMKPAVTKVEDEILSKDIEELNLSVRSFNCLRRYGISTVGDLINKTEDEIMNLRNFGKKSLDEIKAKLTAYNLSLKQTSD